MIQKGYEAPGMAKPNDSQGLMKETKPQKLKMTPSFINRVNPSTSLLEMKVELRNKKFSSQED